MGLNERGPLRWTLSRTGLGTLKKKRGVVEKDATWETFNTGLGLENTWVSQLSGKE